MIPTTTPPATRGLLTALVIAVVLVSASVLVATGAVVTAVVLNKVPVQPFLSNPVANVADVEFTVPAAATILTNITPTTGTWASFSSIYIGNSSTSCVRIGGPTLTTTSGFDIGSGCRDGVGVTLDATGDIYIMDDGGGTVAGVDAIRGKM